VIHARGGVPYEGAIALMRNDAEIQGPRLFRQHCASCHSYLDANGEGIPGPPTPEPGADGEVPPYGCANLYGFASREWLSGLLDPDKIVSDAYFGTTAHRDGDMASFVQDQIRHLDEDGKTALASIIAALSAEAQLVRQSRMDERARADGTIDAGIAALSSPLSSPEATDEYSCTDCHRFKGEGALGSAPDLTGYGSQEWLIGPTSTSAPNAPCPRGRARP
jgi:ubiquinol-cytochrome c reductase cytochrome b subunit